MGGKLARRAQLESVEIAQREWEDVRVCELHDRRGAFEGPEIGDLWYRCCEDERQGPVDGDLDREISSTFPKCLQLCSIRTYL